MLPFVGRERRLNFEFSSAVRVADEVETAGMAMRGDGRRWGNSSKENSNVRDICV
jgi:hypothetical protein